MLTGACNPTLCPIHVFRQPYTGWRNFYVLERIKSGYCLPRPADCPVDVYARVIAPCFLLESHDRPTFQALCDVFASDFPNDVTPRSATDENRKKPTYRFIGLSVFGSRNLNVRHRQT